jgi:hypothetical protein
MEKGSTLTPPRSDQYFLKRLVCSASAPEKCDDVEMPLSSHFTGVIAGAPFLIDLNDGGVCHIEGVNTGSCSDSLI